MYVTTLAQVKGKCVIYNYLRIILTKITKQQVYGKIVILLVSKDHHIVR